MKLAALLFALALLPVPCLAQGFEDVAELQPVVREPAPAVQEPPVQEHRHRHLIPSNARLRDLASFSSLGMTIYRDVANLTNDRVKNGAGMTEFNLGAALLGVGIEAWNVTPRRRRKAHRSRNGADEWQKDLP